MLEASSRFEPLLSTPGASFAKVAKAGETKVGALESEELPSREIVKYPPPSSNLSVVTGRKGRSSLYKA